jgi:Apea-like HEPN
LDAVERHAEFSSVLTVWLQNRSGRRVSRARYLDGLKKTNNYGYDRLVAAANMFDLLPDDAVPAAVSVDPALAKTRDECVAQFKIHQRSIDRDSAISALGRLGKPSLPKKVEHRLAIVSAKMGMYFPDLGLITKYAIRCRNAFVHGNTSEFDLDSLEKVVPFLTETLEFVFATSDFIDSGWDASAWASRPYGAGHSFTRYRLSYRDILPLFKAALREVEGANGQGQL